MYTQYTIFNTNKKKHPELAQICSYGNFSKGLKNEFETAMVNEPSVFEPLKFYCKQQFPWVISFLLLLLLFAFDVHCKAQGNESVGNESLTILPVF